MLSVVGVGVAAALLMGASVPALAQRGSYESVRAMAGDPLPPDWKKVTSLRVLPYLPRQNNNVRIMVHCPTTANHAIIASTAFGLKGSRRPYREVGVGLSDRGLARRTASISYYALLGAHEVRLTCVKVTIDEKTRFREIRVISRCSVPIGVRRFRLAQFFA